MDVEQDHAHRFDRSEVDIERPHPLRFPGLDELHIDGTRLFHARNARSKEAQKGEIVRIHPAKAAGFMISARLP